MPDVTLENISQGVKSSWAASGALTVLIPVNKLYRNRLPVPVPDVNPYPAALFTFKDVSAYFGGTEYFSGRDYVKTTQFNFEVYADRTFDWQTLAQAMTFAFGWSATNSKGNCVIPNAIVLSARPETEGFPEDDFDVYDGERIIKYTSIFTVKMQADRG